VLATLVAALSLAWSGQTIDVPFVPQTDALCGGAAAAMVFRYWGDARADVAQFAPLVERRPGGVVGIANDVLASAVSGKGWRTEHAGDSIVSLASHIAARQPVIVLVADRRDLYHYVVVVGVDADAVVVHDPSWGPSRRIRSAEFTRVWAAADHWSLVVLPSEARTNAAVIADATPAAPSSTADAPADPCDLLLNRAVEDVRAQGLDRADDILARVHDQCPASAGPYRELAGVRFAQRNWREAASLSREALRRQPDDAYALDVLGSSLFMQDDPVGALRAWNRIDKPRLDLVRIDGVHRSRYQTIAEAVGLTPGSLLTANAFLQARHRLDELPDRSSARLAVRPENDGFATVDVVLAERAGLPNGRLGWAGAALRAGVDREVAVAVPGFTGQGEVWSASWRWWSHRPRVAVGFTAPRVGGLPGVWSVEGSWTVETYRETRTAASLASDPNSLAIETTLRESRTHGGLSVSDWLTGHVRYAVSAGVDAWSGGRRAASIGGALERRWLGDRVAVGGAATTWMPVAAGSRFNVVSVRSTIRSSGEANVPSASNWQLDATIGAERASEDAPLSVWPGAGEGRARVPLVRAHPLLDDGTIDVGQATIFGRSVQYASADAVRWLARPQLVRVGVAAFADVARSARSLASSETVTQVDVGGGLRVRMPGAGHLLRIDVAHGLHDGANALTVGWVF
jgi:predicted double-glycine peptidase